MSSCGNSNCSCGSSCSCGSGCKCGKRTSDIMDASIFECSMPRTERSIMACTWITAGFQYYLDGPSPFPA
ncbi:hypothetical protein GOP47_0030120 [Adiantum capillus-veneris]|nr:hypothetical protein GOP47_0030120 [Adiantum capillus-veneris]